MVQLPAVAAMRLLSLATVTGRSLLILLVDVTRPQLLPIYVAFIHLLNHSSCIHTYIYCSIHQELLPPECASSASKSPTTTRWCGGVVGFVVVVANVVMWSIAAQLVCTKIGNSKQIKQQQLATFFLLKNCNVFIWAGGTVSPVGWTYKLIWLWLARAHGSTTLAISIMKSKYGP